jgi:hypothetical protein
MWHSVEHHFTPCDCRIPLSIRRITQDFFEELKTNSLSAISEYFLMPECLIKAMQYPLVRYHER